MADAWLDCCEDLCWMGAACHEASQPWTCINQSSLLALEHGRSIAMVYSVCRVWTLFARRSRIGASHASRPPQETTILQTRNLHNRWKPSTLAEHPPHPCCFPFPQGRTRTLPAKAHLVPPISQRPSHVPTLSKRASTSFPPISPQRTCAISLSSGARRRPQIT